MTNFVFFFVLFWGKNWGCPYWWNMGVEPKIGGENPKWMVYNVENPIKMDDLGIPLFLETPILFRCGL